MTYVTLRENLNSDPHFSGMKSYDIAVEILTTNDST